MATETSAPERVERRLAGRRGSSRWPVVVAFFWRYGALPWAAAIVAGVELAVMAQRGMQWRGDLVWTIDWLPVSFMIVGPVVAGLAAVDVARLAGATEHLSRRPVGRTPSFAVLISYVVVVGATHLAVLATGLVISRPPVGDPFAWLAVLCQILMLVLFVALGTAVGRFVNVVLAGVVAAFAALALVYTAGSPSGRVMPLEFGGATIPRVGYAYAPGYLTAQAGVLILLVVALLVLRPIEGRRARRVLRRDAAVATVLAIAAIAVPLAVPGSRLQAVDARPTWCGAVQTVPTCFYPQHARVAPAFQEQLWVLIDVARDQGYEGLVPGRVAESSRTLLAQDIDEGSGAFYVMPEHLQGAVPTLWEVASGVVQPVHCEQVRGEAPPSDRYWRDLDAVIATWVELAEPGAAEKMGYFGSLLTPSEAAEIVQGFRTCTYQHF